LGAITLFFLWVAPASTPGGYGGGGGWGGGGIIMLLREEGGVWEAFGDKSVVRKYIGRDPRFFGPGITLFHHPSLVNLPKQAIHDIRREERLRER
jgi:hypothetical protein